MIQAASTPSSDERRVMQVAQISEMSLKLHEAEVQNLQQQIGLQQHEMVRQQQMLEDQADLLRQQESAASQAVSSLQHQLSHQVSLTQQYEQECSDAQAVIAQTEARSRAEEVRMANDVIQAQEAAASSRDESSALQATQRETMHALENTITQLQSNLDGAEKNLAASQQDRNGLLHQLGASKRDNGRLQRLQSQCTALEEENAALSASLASQA